MMKFKIGLYAIGVFNGIVFTFAFLCLIVGMDEEFHFMDTEEPLGVDSIVFMDLSSYNIEDIESEYFKRRGPENILDKLLHQYSMVGTIWEEKWDSISDVEKVSILLYDTEMTDRFKHKKKRKKISGKAICPINKEHNNPPQDTIETQEDSCSFFQSQTEWKKFQRTVNTKTLCHIRTNNKRAIVRYLSASLAIICK